MLINHGRSSVTVSSEEVGDLLMALWRQWKSASPVKRGAVTQEQYWVLKTLNEEGPLKIKDLAAKLGCTAGSASVTVKRMERDGMVERERSQRDERVVTVKLSRTGREKLVWWKRDQLKSVSMLFDSLNTRERKTLVRLLGEGLASVPSVNGGRGK